MIGFRKKRKEEPENFKEVLGELKKLKEENGNIKKEIEGLKNKSKFPLQKISVIRFNPFSSGGGDQSFSIALLDGNDNGMVISSIYSREGNRVYTKPIKEGKSDYTLSDEEKEAIKKAISRSINPNGK